MTTSEIIGCGPLDSRFDEALMLASHLHRDQMRKGTEVPYLAHLLAVCALVLEQGGDEDEAIAGLLHDAVEDQGGTQTLELIREQFGDRVAAIVADCSDTDQDPKPDWQERKDTYLAHLRDPAVGAGTLRVSLADKLHNAHSILVDLRRDGDVVWSKFNRGASSQIWYYRSLAEIFTDRLPGVWADELAGTVEEMAALAGSDGAEAQGARRG